MEKLNILKTYNILIQFIGIFKGDYHAKMYVKLLTVEI